MAGPQDPGEASRLWTVVSGAVGGHTFACELALRGVRAAQRRVVAVVNDQVHEEHQDQHSTEGDNNGCAGRGIQLDAEPTTQR